ncbi:MAG: hypothetical protein K2L67_00855 [Clostridia bacterium]|nr:hypothetical protein [Clostridia bacterium]
MLVRINVENNGGFSLSMILILALGFFGLLIGVPCAVCGFIFMSGDGMAILAYACSGITAAATALIIFAVVKRKLKIKKYSKEYQIWKSKPRKERWKWLEVDYSEEEKSPAAKALQNAAMRSAWGYVPSSNSYTANSNSSNNTIRIKLKDGKELHTEERFGDYKTYLYDESGKNTGLHVSGDKVLDDNFNEVGSFDSSGKFNPKN